MRGYEYAQFVDDICRLSDALSEFKADGILFIARGGASMAHFLAMRLCIRKMYAVNTYSYDGQIKLGAPIVDELPSIIGASKIIVVDEIVDSGETLKMVLEKLKSAHPLIEFKTAALFQRESAVIKADYYLHLTDEWIEFFWEKT